MILKNSDILPLLITLSIFTPQTWSLQLKMKILKVLLSLHLWTCWVCRNFLSLACLIKFIMITLPSFLNNTLLQWQVRHSNIISSALLLEFSHFTFSAMWIWFFLNHAPFKSESEFLNTNIVTHHVKFFYKEFLSSFLIYIILIHKNC